jgi:protoheme IX farnesyltransferase
MGVYLLVIAGATTAVADAAAACPTWPACEGRWIVGLENPDLAIAWAHRVAALLVGIGVVATVAVAWLGTVPRRVRAALTVAGLLYPLQVGVGALAATSQTPATLSALHLGVGVAIFAGFVLALAWELEAETATPGDRTPLSRPDPVPVAKPIDDDEAVPVEDSLPDDRIARWRVKARAYLALTKPRLMWLLCLVAVAAMALAAGPTLSPDTVAATLVGGVLAIGASGTFNHVLERDVDRRMNRTADRPLATDAVGVRNAVLFGFFLAGGAMTAFATINLLAAALGLVAILFYSVVYTLVLKPNTVQNTVIGGAAGALPALIGWAAVTGEFGLGGVLLAGVIFLWTPAHFYNLALAYKEDYARGGFPMLPVVRGEAATRRHVLWYFAATLVGAALLAAVTELGVLYALTSVLVGAAFLWAVVRLHREKTERAALRAFHASNAYLGALLVAVVIDSLVV